MPRPDLFLPRPLLRRLWQPGVRSLPTAPILSPTPGPGPRTQIICVKSPPALSARERPSLAEGSRQLIENKGRRHLPLVTRLSGSGQNLAALFRPHLAPSDREKRASAGAG